MSGYMPPPDWGKGRDAPTDDLQVALNKSFRESTRGDSVKRTGIYPNQAQANNAPFRTLQDFIRPGKSLVSPTRRG